jgi:hypothetical protein
MVKQYLQADYSLQEALSDIKEHSLIEGISNVIDLVNENKLVAIVKTPPKSMFARVEMERQLKPIEQDNGQSIASLMVLEEREITVNKTQTGFTTTQFSFIDYASNNDLTVEGVLQFDQNYYTSLSYENDLEKVMASTEMNETESRIAWMECEPDPTKPITDITFTYAEIDDIRITSESLEKLRPKITSDSLSRSPQVIQHTNTTPQYIKTTQNFDELLNRFHHHQAQEKLPEINLELINEFLSEGLKIYLKMPERMSSFWSDELKKEPENYTAQKITQTANSSHATLGSVGYDESESRYYVNSIKVDDEAFELPYGFDIVTKEYLNSLNTSLRHNMEKTCFFAEITRDNLKEFEQKLGIYDHGLKKIKPNPSENDLQDDQFKAAKGGATTRTKADTTTAVELAIGSLGNQASNEDIYNWIKRRVEANSQDHPCFQLIEFEGDDIHPLSIKYQKSHVLLNNTKLMTKQRFQDVCSKAKRGK